MMVLVAKHTTGGVYKRLLSHTEGAISFVCINDEFHPFSLSRDLPACLTLSLFWRQTDKRKDEHLRCSKSEKKTGKEK